MRGKGTQFRGRGKGLVFRGMGKELRERYKVSKLIKAPVYGKGTWIHKICCFEKNGSFLLYFQNMSWLFMFRKYVILKYDTLNYVIQKKSRHCEVTS